MHLLQTIFVMAVLLLQTSKDKPILLLNGTAHLGNGQIISNSAIAIEDQKITMIADATRIRLDMSGYEVKEIYGKHVYAASQDSSDYTEREGKRVMLGKEVWVIDQQKNILQKNHVATLLITEKSLEQAPDPDVYLAIAAGKEVLPAKKCGQP